VAVFTVEAGAVEDILVAAVPPAETTAYQEVEESLTAVVLLMTTD
jgi:hypothetical protein